MFRIRRNAAPKLALPADLSGSEVHVVQHPPMLGGRSVSALVVVEAGYRRLLGAGANRGGEKDVIVPDNGRAPAQTWNRNLPRDVVGLAPGVGQGGIVGSDTGLHAAELRPLVGRGKRLQCEERDSRGQDRNSVHRSPIAIRRSRLGSSLFEQSARLERKTCQRRGLDAVCLAA